MAWRAGERCEQSPLQPRHRPPCIARGWAGRHQNAVVLGNLRASVPDPEMCEGERKVNNLFHFLFFCNKHSKICSRFRASIMQVRQFKMYCLFRIHTGFAKHQLAEKAVHALKCWPSKGLLLERLASMLKFTHMLSCVRSEPAHCF